MELVKSPNDILLKMTDIVKEVPTDETIRQMKDLMLQKRGIGLAANQAGINQRFFIAFFDREFIVCINPRIVNRGKEWIETPEGCLSVTDENERPIFRPKARSVIIDVEYYTIEGFKTNAITKKTLKRLNAKIFQHECDHLEGRLCHG